MTAVTLSPAVRSARPEGFARQLGKIGALALGWLVVVLGILIAPLPGPMGVPIMTVGLILILRASYGAKRMFVRAQRRWPKALSPIRRLLRREPPIAQVFWQQTLRLERLVTTKGHRALARMRKRLKPRRVWRAA
ncbi:hypothetical protein [Caulobacter sp. SLTY]|uniref:hypothetical protein n=1 Tax=Caulobacter sp. SLTY TaxID=2683262 RepID=UPI0014123374|nr:hypothetical protein [Caulobacter sp. SLTY]